ncbi:hypothetical protein [Natrononativus amylolyticus]|uniref:hypothetical protein n=1 Tax=Natrononativus amylolyticus TaxID=2963434 RepID=UPI0020CE0668|nr:hypothetical protein [Natrononativus amylolyticus]
MTLIVDRIEEEPLEEPTPEPTRRRIDVSEMDAAGVREFVRDSVGTDRVSLEHRGSRTYLLVEQ